MDIMDLVTGGAIVTFWGVFMIVAIISYFVTAYPLYKLFEKAGLKNPKYAFIPFVGSLKLFNLANLSAWLYLIVFVPFLGALLITILTVYIAFKMAENFGLGVLGCVLTIFFPVIMYWYMFLTDKPFIGQLDSKYLEAQNYNM